MDIRELLLLGFAAGFLVLFTVTFFEALAEMGTVQEAEQDLDEVTKWVLHREVRKILEEADES